MKILMEAEEEVGARVPTEAGAGAEAGAVAESGAESAAVSSRSTEAVGGWSALTAG